METKQGFHLVFYNNVKELEQDDILKETLGKSANQVNEWIEKFNQEKGLNLKGISLKDYYIIQRKYTEQALEQAKQTNPNIDIKDESLHMDAIKWIWCLKSKFPSTSSGQVPSSRVVRANWDPDDHQVYVFAFDPGDSGAFLGARFSRSFSL